MNIGRLIILEGLMYRNKISVLCLVVTAFFCVGFSGSVFADAAELAKEIHAYNEVFQHATFVEKKKALGMLQWAGLSDPRIYDPLEKLVSTEYRTKDKVVVRQVAYYIKGLSFSGLDRYKSILKQVQEEANSKKLKKYAKTALVRLDNHKKWNPVISSGLEATKAGRNNVQRALNMLESNILVLQKIGAKRIYFQFNSEAVLLKAAKKLLLASYQGVGSDRSRIDMVAWLCKALGNSGKKEYRPVLQEVADKAKNRRVRKYASKYLSVL